MNTRTTTAPTVEPLTLAETKVHLREDLTDAGNDALITSLIAVARQACEHRVQREHHGGRGGESEGKIAPEMKSGAHADEREDESGRDKEKPHDP